MEIFAKTPHFVLRSDKKVMNKVSDRDFLQELALSGRSFVALPDDGGWLRSFDATYAARLERLAKGGSLGHVRRGRYVVMPAGADRLAQIPLGTLLASAFNRRDDAAEDPRESYYLGFLSALAEHRLTDETSDAIHIALRGDRRSLLTQLGDRPIQYAYVNERKWFGVERVRSQGRTFYLRSSIERTLLDTLDRPAYCGPPELWVRAWERAFRLGTVDVIELIDRAPMMSHAVAARTAFMLGELGRPREARTLLRSSGGRVNGAVLFDASQAFGDGDWQRDRETGLILNLPEDAYAGWLAYGK